MLISAQWELVRGNTYAYTVLSAFGLFYGGFGAIVTPLFGVAESYIGKEAEYNNALGFFVISGRPQIFIEKSYADKSSMGCLEFLVPHWIITIVISPS